MSRLALLPLDISISCLLPYIRPEDIDAFALCHHRFESWFQNSDNVRSYLSLRNTLSSTYMDGLRWAADKSTILTRYFVSIGDTDHLFLAMCYAARKGRIDIVRMILGRRETRNIYDQQMAMAAARGYMEIVKLILEHGMGHCNLSMIMAAGTGHIEIVKLMLEHGATNYNWAMAEAAKYGHTEIVKLMLDHGANNYGQATANAGLGGYEELSKLIIELSLIISP